MKNNTKIKNVYALKKGALATAFTAIFIVIVIAVNVLLSVLSAKFPLTLDLNADLRNTLTDENIEYIKSLDKEIKIFAVGSKGDYVDTTSYYAQNYLTTADDSGYYEQTVTLLGEYSKYNDKISVEFMDVNSKDFEILAKNYSGYSYGDLFVECTFNVDGKDVTRRKVVGFKDIYLTKDKSGYAAQGYDYYYVVGSRLEAALASAIYSVTLEKTITIGVPTEYCGNYDSFIGTLGTYLEKNNYQIVKIDGLDISEFSSDLDGILVFDPKLDFPEKTVTAIEKFLSNDGKRGKAFYYFPSETTVNRPNLNEFLEEWGIYYAHKDDEFYTVYEPTTFGEAYGNTIIGSSSKSDYTGSTDSINKYFMTDYPLALERAFETYGLRAVRTVYQSLASSYLRPVGSGDDWRPAKDSVKGSRALILVTNESDASATTSSYVSCFASSDIITSEYNASEYADVVKNLEVVLDIFNSTAGQVSAPFSFEYKQIDTNLFVPTETANNIITIIFVYFATIAIVVVGVVVWVRRKNR